MTDVSTSWVVVIFRVKWRYYFRTTAQEVETSVTNNSLSEDYRHPDDHAKQIIIIIIIIIIIMIMILALLRSQWHIVHIVVNDRYHLRVWNHTITHHSLKSATTAATWYRISRIFPYHGKHFHTMKSDKTMEIDFPTFFTIFPIYFQCIWAARTVALTAIRTSTSCTTATDSTIVAGALPCSW